MTNASTMILLAGALRYSPLRKQLDVPVLALPLAPSYLLLNAWLERLSDAPALRKLVVVVNSHADAKLLQVLAEPMERPAGLELDVMVDPAPWRGPGGLIYDICSRWEAPESVLVGEAACLPPRDAAQFAVAVAQSSGSGLVASTPSRQPAGLYAFSREAVAAIPSVGYFDIKEQLLPRLYEDGLEVRAVPMEDEVQRVRTRAGYLDAVQAAQADRASRQDPAEPGGNDSADGLHCAESAQIAGTSVIQPGVIIEDGAVVHDSVICSGARVGRGAIVSRSVIGPQAVVRPHEKMVRRVVDGGSVESPANLPAQHAVVNGENREAPLTGGRT